jgi:hypothetical protein
VEAAATEPLRRGNDVIKKRQEATKPPAFSYIYPMEFSEEQIAELERVLVAVGEKVDRDDKGYLGSTWRIIINGPGAPRFNPIRETFTKEYLEEVWHAINTDPEEIPRRLQTLIAEKKPNIIRKGSSVCMEKILKARLEGKI